MRPQATGQRLSFLGSAVLQQQQQRVLQPLASCIQRMRSPATGQSTLGHSKEATLPSTRQVVLDLLTFRLPERRSSCLICLEDIGISKMLHLEDCSHSYCKACTAMHLQTKLRDDQHDILRCPFPQCTAMFIVVQSQELLSCDAMVNTSSFALRLLCMISVILIHSSCRLLHS